MEEVGFTTVKVLAQVLHSRLEPAQRDSGDFEEEDIAEEIRNAYAGVLWKIHMANMADGDRTALESLLQIKEYAATPETEFILLEDAMIIDLPRDAGVYSVASLDTEKKRVATLTKTTPAGADAPKSKIDPGKRYFRVGKRMFFPDGLPKCTAFIGATFYGLDTSDATAEIIPRDYADLVRDKVWNALFPGKQIQADNTNNLNPNQ